MITPLQKWIWMWWWAPARGNHCLSRRQAIKQNVFICLCSELVSEVNGHSDQDRRRGKYSHTQYRREFGRYHLSKHRSYEIMPSMDTQCMVRIIYIDHTAHLPRGRISPYWTYYWWWGFFDSCITSHQTLSQTNLRSKFGPRRWKVFKAWMF